MPKINMPKSTPSIDMTPMVDLAFLLVTFFMLSANFRSNDIVQVDTPSSISDKAIPENVIMVSVDKGGRVFFGMSGNETVKTNLLANMAAKYKMQFTNEQVKAFTSLTNFGCTMQELPGFLNLSAEERKEFVSEGKTAGIPSDSTNNQLKDWIYYGNVEALAAGEVAYLAALDKGLKAEVNEFKPKFVLKVDGKAVYLYAKQVIDVFRDLNLNNLNFVTSLEQDPRTTL